MGNVLPSLLTFTTTLGPIRSNAPVSAALTAAAANTGPNNAKHKVRIFRSEELSKYCRNILRFHFRRGGVDSVSKNRIITDMLSVRPESLESEHFRKNHHRKEPFQTTTNTGSVASSTPTLPQALPHV